MSIYSRSIKARKAKYGWDLGSFRLGMVIELGEFMKALQTNFSTQQYSTETVGMHSTDIRLYTDNDDCADWIRGYFAAHQ